MRYFQFSLLKLFVLMTVLCCLAARIPQVIRDIKVITNTYTAEDLRQ